ncbi:MAG: extracellular solute-binding protein [Clostridiales bacterium]|nr:extracellular solute-binding protein [Candidatus Apopatocola equi]
MKKTLALLLAAAMMLALCACGKTEAPAPAEEAPAAEATEAAPEATEATETLGTGVELTVYTNSGSSGRDAWLTERAAKEGFKVVVLEDGAGAIQQRLIGEAANPIADVVYGLNAIIWNDLISRDILVAYDAPSWASEVSEGLNNADGYYYAIVKQAIVLAYDAAKLSPEEAPKDWPDLWENEAFHGIYRVEEKLTGGTTRNVLAGILCRYLDPNGELGVSEEGWAAIEKFFQYGVVAESETNLYQEMVDETKPTIMGQMWSSGVVQYDNEFGTTSGWAIPEVGVPYAVEGIGLVNGVQNDEAKYAEALRFIEWFGSAEIQGEWAEQFGTMPANEKAAEKADAVQAEICSIPAQDIDWAVVAANIDDWCEKITLEYMQ